MMIDPFLSLALAVHTSKGTYAILLGSGVSRAASIPTGWEIVLDLTRRLARLRGEDCEPDPAAWFRTAYSVEPDYAGLLDAVAKTPTERRQLLRGYFEPSDLEREQGLKVPTAAHHAIAQLMQRGCIRVVVTTNFDRLLEEALTAAGVRPVVISTPDAAEGAMPLTHAEHVVIKLHGDYLDTRLKNTPDELSHYDPRMDALLDRILDEFGLIVCGWSAEWDPALRAAIERCKTHRFTTFWSTLGTPADVAQRLASLRRAEMLEGLDADRLFTGLADKLIALDEFSGPHPLSTMTAVATLKRYLSEDRFAIPLNDLVMSEATKLHDMLGEAHFASAGVQFDHAEMVRRVRQLEAITEIMQSLMITGCYWGSDEQRRLWTQALELVANPPRRSIGPNGWDALMLYPALILLYAGGMAAIAANRYATLAALLTEPRIVDGSNEAPAGHKLNTWEILEPYWQQELPGVGTYTPLSEHLCALLREPLRIAIPRDGKYEETFDRFEYLLGLVCGDLVVPGPSQGEGWGPAGCFLWRHYHDQTRRVMSRVEQELQAAGDQWPPLQAGLFGGNLERLRTRKSLFDAFIQQLRRDQGVH